MASKHTVSPAGEAGAGARCARVDGEQTRARIIETAGQLMAENGFAQTTSKRICETANINMAAINYHFGSREGLYLAVLEDMHNRIIDREFLDNLAGEAIPAREKMQRIVAALMAGLAAPQQWHVRAWAREIVAPSVYFQEVMRRVVAANFRIIKGIISDMTGIPQDAPELECCLVSALGPFVLLLVADRRFSSALVPLLCQAPCVQTHMGDMAMCVLDAAARSWQQRQGCAC